MNNLKQYLIDEIKKDVTAKDLEISESDKDIEILSGKLKVERKASTMKDMPDELREDFKYSLLALEGMFSTEQKRNLELKTDLKVLRFREAVIESQFPSGDLD